MIEKRPTPRYPLATLKLAAGKFDAVGLWFYDHVGLRTTAEGFMKGYRVESTFVLTCPNCETRHEDAWDVLDASELHDMRCNSCDTPFFCILKECVHCGEESSFVSSSKPSTAALDALLCQWCASAFLRLDDNPHVTRPTPRRIH